VQDEIIINEYSLYLKLKMKCHDCVVTFWEFYEKTAKSLLGIGA
jgi:hypothetical protein